MTDQTLHISSLLLRAEPARMEQVFTAIKAVPGSDVALSDESGKIIVTLETPSERQIVDALNTLQLIDGVVSAALVFHQADTVTG